MRGGRACLQCLSVVAALLSTPGCRKATPGGASLADQPKDVADAAKLVEVGQCETAVDKLKTYVSSNPDAKEAYLVLGDAWTCRAFAKGMSSESGDFDTSALQQADTAYASALKLAPNDARALVSAGAVEVFLGDAASAKTHLEAARTSDASNLAALNLLALLETGDRAVARFDRSAHREAPPRADASGDAAPPPVLKLLAEGYRGRKGASGAIAGLPDVCTQLGCGRAAFLADSTIEGNAFPAGTIIEPVMVGDGSLDFRDHLHPSKRPGTGWSLVSIGELRWSHPAGDTTTVVSRLPPPQPTFPQCPVPRGDGSYDFHCNDVINDWKRNWSLWGCGGAGCRFERDIPAYLARLGPVADVVPGSVKTTGANVPEDGALFSPVAFDTFEYDQRPVDPKLVSRVSVSAVAAAAVCAAGFLSEQEKRALLVGKLVAGTPLAIGVLVRRYDLRRARISLDAGRVTLAVEVPGGVDTYVNGELTSTTAEWKPPTDERLP